MKSITITTYPSMPDRFRVECAPGAGKKSFGRDAANAGEAAAVALSYANADGFDYVILGHRAAVDQIPAELRFRRK